MPKSKGNNQSKSNSNEKAKVDTDSEKVEYSRRFNFRELAYERRKKKSKDPWVLIDRKDAEKQPKGDLTHYEFNKAYVTLSKSQPAQPKILSMAEVEIEKEAGTFNADLKLKKIGPQNRREYDRYVYLREVKKENREKGVDYYQDKYEIVLRAPHPLKPTLLYTPYFYRELWPHSKQQIADMLRLYRATMEKEGLWETHGWKDKIPKPPSKKEYIPADIDDFMAWCKELDKGQASK